MRRHWSRDATRLAVILFCACLILAGGYAFYSFFPIGQFSYSQTPTTPLLAATSTLVASTTPPEPPPFVVSHIDTPQAVKAIYYSSWAAGSKKYRAELFKILDKTEVNAVVIDVKDYSGRISFPVEDPYLKEIGSAQDRIPDIKEFIAELHKRGVYVIGRISSFQDSYLINVHPEWAVKTKEGTIWHDKNNVKWLDAGAEPVWEYLADIGREAYADGFDELNFDYIRYPSDGDLSDIAYSWSAGKTRAEVMKGFFQYLSDQFSGYVPISADLFGLTTSAEDDLGIGQVLTDAIPYFDYIDPMVYPSHFGYDFLGYPKPATKPYEVVKYSMDHASIKAESASSSPSKLRPWLQAFDLGAIYTPAMVRTQIQATYDSGLNSWLLWNAASEYNIEAFLSRDSDSLSDLSSTTFPSIFATSTRP